MMARLSGQFKGDDNTGAQPVKVKWKWIIIGIFIIFLLAYFMSGGDNGQTYSRSGSGGLWFLLGMLADNVGRSGGSDWGGGGFGGFGGGDSGGGGAGGDW
jgi:uncharacterized protein